MAVIVSKNLHERSAGREATILILKICVSDWNLTEHIGLSNEGNN